MTDTVEKKIKSRAVGKGVLSINHPFPVGSLYAQVIEVEFTQPTHECSPECPCGRMTDEERQKFFPG